MRIKFFFALLFISMILVIAVIYFFLSSSSATFIPAITIPVSIISTFYIIYLFGFSLNVLTFLALVLAIGLIVDDSIVVLENIKRRIENGEEPYQAFLHQSQVKLQVGLCLDLGASLIQNQACR